MSSLFIRQPFTETEDSARALVQSVLDVIVELARARNITLLTGGEAQTGESFIRHFEQTTGEKFTPKKFRDYRLSLLDKADAIVYIRTDMSESGAFELAYNIFKGRKAPVLFCLWQNKPIKTTLLRDLEDMCPITYVSFSQASDLLPALKTFIEQL